MNRIKEEQCYPKCLELCNISSIWKRKNARDDFESYRGIFRVTIFRTILDRLIYNDEIGNIDSNLTDCNVGARKHRNIRDNIFVMNAILVSKHDLFRGGVSHEYTLSVVVVVCSLLSGLAPSSPSQNLWRFVDWALFRVKHLFFFVKRRLQSDHPVLRNKQKLVKRWQAKPNH